MSEKRTTGFGEICARDTKALQDVMHARKLHHDWLAESGVTVE